MLLQVDPINDELEMRRNAMYKYWEGDAIFEYHDVPRMHLMGGRTNACHCKYLPRKENLNWDITFPDMGWSRGCTGLGVIYCDWRKWVMCFGGLLVILLFDYLVMW